MKTVKKTMEAEDWRTTDAQKVFIEYGSPQWWAWDKYTRKTANPNGLPRTTSQTTGKAGWRCMSEWPPGHPLQAIPEKTKAESPNAEINYPLRLAIRRKACERIRCTALADPANKEGWLHGLIDFVVEYDRMPDKKEQGKLRRTAEGIEENLTALALQRPTQAVKGWIALSGSNALPALRKMRAAMVARAEREVFGELESPQPKVAKSDPYAEAMAAAPNKASRTAAQPDRSLLPDLPLSDSGEENNALAGL